MNLRIGFAYNQKPAEDEEPPSGEPPSSGPDSRTAAPTDRYAEWDDPATIDAVESALRPMGEVIRLEADQDFPLKLRHARPDIVFNIAEGSNGPNRESHVPAMCEFYGVPYTGSDPLTLSLSLDKQRAKEVWLAQGVATPRFLVHPSGWAAGRGAAGWLNGLQLPVMVKPLHEGSSKGVPERAFCRTAEAAVMRAAEVLEEYGQPALVEEFLPGREFTCAVLGNGAAARALPLVELRFDALPAEAAPIYGYEAKWVWDTPQAPLEIFACPAALEAELAASIEATALAAYRALGCRDWARVDLRLDARGEPQVLEINPLPGILPDPAQNSCFPKAARAAGMDYNELICTVLRLALERYGMRS
ncbi:MAG: D-alanine--D-alanine ligase [Gemmatimonadetes bacterium]|nr:D-alanine--D-alanine ligase [Gemmatimonadota bacterium]